MASENEQQQHFSPQGITTNDRQTVNNQAAAAARFSSNSVQMGINQPQTNTVISGNSGPANMQLPNSQRTRSRDLMENQGNNQNVFYPVPDYAPEDIREDMMAIRDAAHVLCQGSKRLRILFEEKQKEAVQHLVDSARIPILQKLNEKNGEIVKLRKLNMTLEKNLLNENLAWREYAISCEIKVASLSNKLEAAMAEVSRLQGLLPPNDTLAAPAEAQNVASFAHTNVSEKNTNAQGEAKVVAVQDAQETEAEKIKTRAAEKGEGSGEKKKCMLCGEFEMSVLAWPCWHLCFCMVCGTPESRLQGLPCPVCGVTMKAAVPVSIT
ncbi:BOI-related E3 ubiquitin-protein ligase 1-like [Daucus carota subsp. sativus]|uniref:BOI-related E3 ubiquitin-protein ligase 1-like n=1 Tax=Daucus carota subsp. sativus TaxID=79200 RepID=UPI00308366E0